MKEKILTIMFSLFCLTAIGQNNQNSTLWGDVNRDGVVSLIDADELANYIMGKPSAIPSETEADVNNDGFVNAADIVKIINVVNSSNTDIKNLFIWKSDGSYVTYRLNETEGLNFNDNGILVKSNGIDDTYYYNLISKITYGSSEEAAPSTVGTPAQDVTYIYRNDGGFNAFYNTEIETIRFSSLGIDGIVYPKLVVQEISTKDSLYRIPFSVIDSISFSKPATIYVNGVRKIDDLIPYITQAEDLSLTLSDNTPISLSPKIGEVLLYEHFDKDFLPYGFAGRVIQIVNSTYICEPVTLDDVYERLIGIGSAMFADAQQSGSPKTRGVSGESSDAIKLKLTVGKEENGIHGSIEGFLACGIRVVYRHERNKSHYISATIAPKLGAAAEIGVNGKLEGDWIAPKIDLLYFPIPSTPFLLNLSSGPALKPSLEANLTARFELSWEGEMGFTFDNGSWHKYYRNLSKDKKPLEITGDVDGRLFTGVATDFGICSYGKILSLVKETEVGLDIVANLSTNLLNSNKYEELSNANVEANFIGNLGLKGELKFTRFIKFERKINIASLEWNINSWKVVPTFKNITVAPANNNSYVVSVEPSDKILWWLPIGLGLYDKNDELQDYNYCVDLYKDIDSWPLEKFQATFNNVSPSQEYTVAPLVKIFGVDLKASPEINISPSIKCTTGNASNINYSSATLNGTVENYNKEDENIKFVFLYSTSEDIQNSSDGRTVEASCDDNGNLTVDISDLTDYTTYYYAAAYKAGDADYVLGEVKSFKTTPLVTTIENPETTVVSATLRGTCSKGIYNAGFSVKKYGNAEYTQYNACPDENGNFSITIDGLDANTQYVFYAFVIANEIIYLGEEFEFVTETNPSVITLSAQNLSQHSATIYASTTGNVDKCLFEVYRLGGANELGESVIDGESFLFEGVKNEDGNYSYTLTNLISGYEYYYSAYAELNDVRYSGEELSFRTNLCPDENHPHMIDLGLPSGIKWACCNVGASSPEKNGNYYAWGETEQKSSCTWENYIYQYPNTWFINLGNDISGTSYDVAHVKWGDGWKMPSKIVFQEIVDNCIKVPLYYPNTNFNSPAYLFISANKNSILLPDAGCLYDSSPENYSGVTYWTSTQATPPATETEHKQRDAYCFRNMYNIDTLNRLSGLPVRAVWIPKD